MKINIDKDAVNIKGIIKNYSIKISEIENAYIRIEDANANMCCGRMSFPSFFLMIKDNEKLHKLQMDKKDDVLNALDTIEKYNPSTKIGYFKNDNSTNTVNTK